MLQAEFPDVVTGEFDVLRLELRTNAEPVPMLEFADIGVGGVAGWGEAMAGAVETVRDTGADNSSGNDPSHW